MSDSFISVMKHGLREMTALALVRYQHDQDDAARSDMAALKFALAFMEEARDQLPRDAYVALCNAARARRVSLPPVEVLIERRRDGRPLIPRDTR